MAVNCAEACVNGCVLGDKCPHREHLAATSKFLQEKSMDEILAIAQKGAEKRFVQRLQEQADQYFSEEK